MEILVSVQPHMLLETVELMYAYVNGILPQDLTEECAYCIPADAIQQMMDVSCANVSREDPAVQYYFGKHILPGDVKERATCIARNLAYNSMEISRGSIAADCERLRINRQIQLRENDRIASIGEYSLQYIEPVDDAFVPMARDIARLDVSPDYAQMLLEEFSGFDVAVSRLEKLVTPVAEKLEPLLTPWAEQAEPLAQRWNDYFNQPDAMDQFLRRIQFKEETGLRTFQAQLRYLVPKAGPGRTLQFQSLMYIHMGLAVPIERKMAESFESWEFQAFRLLGSETQMCMLRAMLDQPMSARELAQLLNLHLGPVARDISNLYNMHLLKIEAVNGRRRYRTNMDTMHLLMKHMGELEKFDLF